MNISIVLPFLLFLLTIVINLVVINSKLNDKNQNTNAQKRILEKIRRAEQNLNDNIILTEEKISSQKIEVNNICSQIDNKIRELTSHSQELAQLSNTLNEYRSMLAVLEVSTNKTHEWVITVRNDCKKLEELQKIIEEHQKTTVEVINSYGEAVEKQNNFYGEYEKKLENIKNNYINEVNDYVRVAVENLNSKIISINQVSNEANKSIKEAKQAFDNLAKEEIQFATESKNTLQEYKKERDIALEKAKEDIAKGLKDSIELHKTSIGRANEQYLIKYAKEIENINLRKMVEADEALNTLIDSINYLKEADNTKNKSFNNNNKATKIIKEEKKEPLKQENEDTIGDDNKESEIKKQKSINKDDKIFYPIGEEEEILLD